jgi:hypothetical protein
MGFVENDFERGEDHSWNIFSRMVREGKGERLASQVPNFGRIVLTAVK